MKRYEVCCTAGLFILGILIIVHTSLLPLMGPRALSPGIFPMVVGFLMVIFSGAELLKFYKAYRQSKEENLESRESRGSRADAAADRDKSILMIILILLAYILVLPYIHFIAATTIFLITIMSYIYRRITAKIVVISVLVTLGINYSFTILFKLILP